MCERVGVLWACLSLHKKFIEGKPSLRQVVHGVLWSFYLLQESSQTKSTSSASWVSKAWASPISLPPSPLQTHVLLPGSRSLHLRYKLQSQVFHTSLWPVRIFISLAQSTGMSASDLTFETQGFPKEIPISKLIEHGREFLPNTGTTVRDPWHPNFLLSKNLIPQTQARLSVILPLPFYVMQEFRLDDQMRSSIHKIYEFTNPKYKISWSESPSHLRLKQRINC